MISRKITQWNMKILNILKNKIIPLIKSNTICWITDLNAVTKLYFFLSISDSSKMAVIITCVWLLPYLIQFYWQQHILSFKNQYIFWKPTQFCSIPFGAHTLFRPRARRTGWTPRGWQDRNTPFVDKKPSGRLRWS